MPADVQAHGNHAAVSKRNKAQEVLRNRMRQRISGGDVTSTSHPHAGVYGAHQAKRRGRRPFGGRSLSASMEQSSAAAVSSVQVTPGDLLGSNYMNWQSQHGKEGPSTQDYRPRSPRVKKNQTIPIQELVNRVINRRDHDLGLRSKIAAPMTISSFKTKAAPYVIRQTAHLKKLVGDQSTQKSGRVSKDGEPPVVVLERNDVTKTPRPRAGKRRNITPDNAEETVIDGEDEKEEASKNKTTTQTGAAKVRQTLTLETVRPPPAGAPKLDSMVTNFRLQIRDQIKATKLQAPSVPANHVGTTSKVKIQSTNPLPPISASSSSSSGLRRGKIDPASAMLLRRSRRHMRRAAPRSGVARTSSKAEILNMTKERQGKRHGGDGGVDGSDDTLLGTGQRFTNKTMQFKSEIARVRRLSAISEDIRQVGKLDSLW